MKLAVRDSKIDSVKLQLLSSLELEEVNIVAARTNYGGITILNVDERKNMKFSEIELPSNRKFGFFFTFVFVVVAAYFYYSGNLTWAYVFIAAALLFLLVTLIKSDALVPLNKLWMWFGLLLGMIVSPIVLGVIFFGLFTPIAMLMRLSGRDELRLKFTQKPSHWISRGEPIKSDSFKHQF